MASRVGVASFGWEWHHGRVWHHSPGSGIKGRSGIMVGRGIKGGSGIIWARVASFKRAGIMVGCRIKSGHGIMVGGGSEG